MTRKDVKELIEKMKQIQKEQGGDPEAIHGMWDDLLLDYIANDELKKLWRSQKKWYA